MFSFLLRSQDHSCSWPQWKCTVGYNSCNRGVNSCMPVLPGGDISKPMKEIGFSLS